MQAIILAAGMGRRLGTLTAGNTKCMLEVNGKRLIDRAIDALIPHNIDRIVIVAGFARQNLINHVNEKYPGLNITFIENPVYDHTNNIYSLWLAKDYLTRDDTLLMESDLIFDPGIIDCALQSPFPNVALVAKYKPWMDGTMVKLDSDNTILNFIPKADFDFNHTDQYYKTVNIYKLSRDFAISRYIPFLEAYIKSMGNNEYYEQVLRVLTMINTRDIHAVDIRERDWYEIDDIQDLMIAETIFADYDKMLLNLQKSYGGYWRYPALTDFCYLVNPYFPPAKLVDEMKGNFDTLLREYPSGMGVNSILAGKYFGIESDYVAVGNGAAELIKEVIHSLPLPAGTVTPTFEEYLNRLPEADKVTFQAPAPDFSYGYDDIIGWVKGSGVKSLVIVNPDNPSGNFIPLKDVMRLIEWTKKEGITLVMDESFVDFSAEGYENSLLHNDILVANPHLIVVKSISKSYGVPGLRLGVIASGNVDLISAIKKGVAIWNINSFAEFYMQIFGKYESEYIAACGLYARERDRLVEELRKIEWLNVAPSQANFVLARIKKDVTARDVAIYLLKNYNILIKDCTGKRGFGQSDKYIRLAVRDRKDNDRLLEALRNFK